MINVEDVRLTDVTEIEAWDAAKRSRPELTWEEFDQAWKRFLQDKALRQAQRKLH